MSAGGLSRRRVPASYNDDNDDEGASSRGRNTPASTNGGSISRSDSLQSPQQHAGSAFEGGSRIAYDPRDLEREDEDTRLGGKPPKLTIMEEVLLLGLKDKQGYLSFWNDNISYALRGCILIELALRRRIALVKDPNRKHLPLAERLIEVLDERQTGETILDEALRMMKGQEQERMAVNSWIDLLSGETWNVMKIGYQLKQVRERLAKGLVDKGILRTEKRNFLLFDMATHPVADPLAKRDVVGRVASLLTATTAAVPTEALHKDEATQCRVVRAVCLVCAAYAASVLDNAFTVEQYEIREAAFQRCDEILAEFASWPWEGGASRNRRREASSIAMGSDRSNNNREIVLNLVQKAKEEKPDGPNSEDLCFELVAGVLEVLSKVDSLL